MERKYHSAEQYGPNFCDHSDEEGDCLASAEWYVEFEEATVADPVSRGQVTFWGSAYYCDNHLPTAARVLAEPEPEPD